MIAYRDFTGKAGKWIPSADLTASVELANEWLASTGMSVINVESVYSRVGDIQMFANLRVWYLVGPTKPEPLPEL